MRLKNFSLQFGQQVFKAMSDESRIRIMNLLLHNKELCGTDIELILDFTQTKTSRHMNNLKNAGLVRLRKEDMWTFYYIKEEVLDVVEQIFKYLEKDQTMVQDLENYRVLFSNRELVAYKITTRKWTNNDPRQHRITQ
jgi:ArsR family transcriptional regulator